MKKIKNKKKYNKLFIVLAVLTLGLIITRGYSHARYASNAVFNYYLSSKGFFFNSEDLTFDTKNNVDTMWDGDKVYFTLSNSANDALASEVDIKYSVKCTINEEDTTKKCLVNGTDSDYLEATMSASFGCSDGTNVNEETCVANKKEWVSKPTTSKIYFEVIDTSGADVLNANVNIVVTTLKPYSKELSANYSLIRDKSAIGGLSMKYEEGLIKSKLIVTNSYNEDKCVNVSWNSSDFVYDNNTSNVLGTGNDTDGNINSVYFKLNKMDSKLLEFYGKASEASYNELYFQLVESNLCE